METKPLFFSSSSRYIQALHYRYFLHIMPTVDTQILKTTPTKLQDSAALFGLSYAIDSRYCDTARIRKIYMYHYNADN